MARQILLATPQESSPEVNHGSGSVTTFRPGVVSFSCRAIAELSVISENPLDSSAIFAPLSHPKGIVGLKMHEWVSSQSVFEIFVYVLKTVHDSETQSCYWVLDCDPLAKNSPLWFPTFLPKLLVISLVCCTK